MSKKEMCLECHDVGSKAAMFLENGLCAKCRDAKPPCVVCGEQFKELGEKCFDCKFQPDADAAVFAAAAASPSPSPSPPAAASPSSPAATAAAGVSEAAAGAELAQLRQMVHALTSDVAHLKKALATTHIADTRVAFDDAPCKVCGLNVAANEFCSQTGTRHISSAEAQKRTGDVVARFQFHPGVLEKQGTVRCVLHFVAFYDVLGARPQARDEAEQWLRVHHLRFHDLALKAKPDVEQLVCDSYYPSFAAFCTTGSEQSELQQRAASAAGVSL